MFTTVFTVIGLISVVGWIIVMVAEIVDAKKSYEYCFELYSNLHTRVCKLEEKDK